MKNNNIRVRFAPSPSGYLHVGSARTAIFNWLFARHNGGQFLIRIEDTDKERSRPELIEPILSAMEWLGVDWDEEPYYQSRRLELYKPYVQKLLDSGHAYRCFCHPEELEEARKRALAAKEDPKYDGRCRHLSQDDISERLARGEPFAVRLKIPPGETSYHDLVSGTITRQNSEIEDLILARRDGSVVYNMAVVVDDHEMGITHVIRGNDHINNTFKQILIYRGLGLDQPAFAHIPLILRPDKKKVSKRLGAKDVGDYRREGILAEALFNFLCLLGWSPKDDREFLPRDELVEIFRIENVNRSNPIFEEDKLLALNRLYIKDTPDHKLAEMVAPMLVEAGLTSRYWLETRWQYLLTVISLLKERTERLTDFVSMSEYFFQSEFGYEPKAREKHFTADGAGYLKALLDKFDRLPEFTKESLESVLNEAAEEMDLKRGKLIHPTRLAVSGTSRGPGLFDILETIGKKETIDRMKRAVDFIAKSKG